MSTDEGAHAAAEEGKAPLPDYKDLVRMYAESQLRDVLFPQIVDNFMKGVGHMEFSAMVDVLPHLKAAIEAKGFKTKDLDNGPVPPGLPPRPGLRVYLHSRPDDPHIDAPGGKCPKRKPNK